VHWRCLGQGSGVPILLIHGGPGLTSGYMEPLGALGDARAVFIWDQLDCGRSDRPHDRALWTLPRFVEELDAVRAALTPGPVHVLGHSWGTTLALEWLATRRPVDVASLVLMSPCLDVPRWIRDTRELVAGLSADARAAIAEAEQSGRFDTPGYQRAAWNEWLLAHVVRSRAPGLIEALLAELSASNVNFDMLEYMWGPSDFTVTGSLRTFNRTADLASLQMPVLFLCGEFDEALPRTASEQAALVPRSACVVVPGSGHLTMIDAPEATNRAISDFLTGAEQAARSPG
jgi:proline iminopeptidase